jgi:lipopolysaccharide transport system ATP-binding protein
MPLIRFIMSKIVIEVEELAKQYRLGQVGRRTLSHDINRWWYKMRGKDDPYIKIGQENDRTTKAESEYVWALQNINFKVKEGEVLGIIGRNGAGKSTLLKILSKVTAPTKGQVKIKGRIASLLEVGTGFHPDLSGRENIFLNGAILGMTKKEILSKFDEIVDFAGVEKYIDTPVKRYSSGMYVRLAFAVAAHLEPEILIIDEVLAVGDADFQKKCLGKMKDVSEIDGRTVLFVSHNMDAVSRLCNNCIYLKNGFIKYMSNTEDIISKYLMNEKALKSEIKYTKKDAPGNRLVKLLGTEILDNQNRVKINFVSTENINVRIIFEVFKETDDLVCGFNLYNQKDVHLFTSHDTINYTKKYHPGIYEIIVSIPKNLLANGSYYCGIAGMSYKPFTVHFHDVNKIFFNITDNAELIYNQYTGILPGIIRPSLDWKKVSLHG